MKRILSLLLALCLLLAMVPAALGAETRGVSLTTDSAFFNAFTLSKMPAVQSAVNAGNYTLAKQELLNYYTAKFKNYNPIPASPNRTAMVYLASQNAFAFSENYMGSQYITSTDYKEYQFNMGTNRSVVYVMSMIHKTTGEILIPSSEASSMVPSLILTLADGSTKTLYATADTYVRAGSYASSNYGSATTLYAHHDVSGTTPYAANTKRIYMKFDSAAIPSNVKNIKLSIYAKCSGMSSSETKLRLNVFSAYSTTWTESGLTWNWLTNNNGHGHFSWNGASGGFTWTKPTGTPNEWLNYNTRFYEVSSLVQSAVAAGTASANYKTYLTTAKNLMIDFINDAGAGKPANRSIEPANRLMEFPYIYKHLLASGLLTPDENVKLLSWVYDEAVYMNGGATIFNSSNGVISDMAYTNHGFWHLAGFYQSFGFFPEFAKASTWRNNYNARQPKVVDALIYSDGSYNEVTFGYPSEVINWSSVLLTAMSTTGDTSAVAITFKGKLVNLAKYLVDCTMPNGTAPFWGQGGPAATKTAVNKVLDAIGTTMDSNQTVQELRYYVNHSTGSAPDTYGEYDNIKVVADRTGWDSTDSMIFMNAKSGGNHAHRDANALLFYYGGRSLLTDTGMTSYDSAHAHYAFQNSKTKSHNTIEIDGVAQTWTQNLSDAASKGNIDMVSNAGVSNIRAWTTATTNFTHYRNVSYIKGLGSFMVVTDKVVPSNSSSHTYRQNWHCAPYSNPSIASDVHDTGKTAYASGSNLIIAQAYNIHNTALNTEITATLQTGYDSSAATTTTKYFEYKQSKSGVATYQTVLYPVSAGATATVTPVKLSMTSTGDDIALASRIAIEDSANPNLKVLYHYNSFESTPSTRAFGGHTTDASTAMLGLNKASNGQTIFVSIANGSTLHTSSYNLVTVSAKVTDLSIRLDGTTMVIESSDPNIGFRTITSNLSGQTVKKVTLNGKTVAFHQATDGTVTVGNLYFLTNFDKGDPLAQTSDWTGARTTPSVNNTTGLLSGSFTEKDPYLSSKVVLSYTVRSGDIVELRVKNTVTSGTYTPLQFFYTTKEHTTYTEGKSCRDTHTTYPANDFVVARMALPADAVGQVITAIRVDPVNSSATDPAQGSYAIDYIYIGPADLSPSAQNKTYTVTFCKEDGTVLGSETVSAGAAASYTGTTPTKAADSNSHYSFAGWIDAQGKAADLSSITADLKVYASFTAAAHGFTFQSVNSNQHKRTCITCGFADQKNHNFTFASTGATEHKRVCSNCKYEDTANHSWDSGVVTKAATCTEAGVKTYTCSVCNGTKTETIAAIGHSYDGGVITTMPTLTATGIRTFTCKNNSSHSYTEVLEKLSEDLLFDFSGKAGSYDNAAYGFVNFDDAANWYYYKDVNVSDLTIDPEDGTLKLTAVGSLEDTRYPCVYFDTIINGSYHSYPLNYDPQNAEVYQLRFKMENMVTGSYTNESGEISTPAPYMILQYFVNGENSALTATDNTKIPVEVLGSGEYVTITAALNETFRAQSKIDKIRVFFGGIESLSTETPGKITLDYVYIGTEDGMPTANYTVTFKGADGAVLATQVVNEGGTAVYSGATPTKESDMTYHYSFSGWDKALTNITADTVVTAEFTATAHSKVTDKGYAATCQSEGLSDGQHCSVCGKVLVEQTVLPIGDHSAVTVPGTPATCLNSGISDGSKCSVCGLVLEEQQILPRLGHSYSYTNNGSNHTASCTRCGKTQTAAHSFTDGSCVCGAVEYSGPVTDPDILIGHTLNLASDISVNYAVKSSLLEAYDSYYMQCILPIYEGELVTGYQTVLIDPVKKGSYDYFTLSGLTAVQMGDVVEATLYLQKDGVDYVSNTDSYSIAQYAYSQLNKSGSSDTLKRLCADLLRYGAAAQSFKGYRTDSLCDSAMTLEQLMWLSDIGNVTFGNLNTEDGDLTAPVITWVGKALNLDSKVTVRFAFSTANYSGDPTELTLRIRYINYQGEEVEQILSDPQVYGSADRYAFSFDGLLAGELRTAISATVYEGETQLSNTLHYSPDTYGNNKTGALGTLCKALFAYSDSAKSYFAAP